MVKIYISCRIATQLADLVMNFVNANHKSHLAAEDSKGKILVNSGCARGSPTRHT